MTELKTLRTAESQQSEVSLGAGDGAVVNPWRGALDSDGEEDDDRVDVVEKGAMKVPLTRWDTKGKALDARQKAKILKKTVLVKKKVLQIIQEEQRSRFYRSIVKYVIFMTFLMYVFWWTPREKVFKGNDAIREVFVMEEFSGIPIKKDFFDIDTREEFWQWVTGPLIGGFYEDDVLLMHQVPIGGIRFRQVRVQEEMCQSALLEGEKVPCYPEWEDAKEEKSDFLGMEYRDNLSWLYPSKWDTYEVLFMREYATEGGFVTDLPASDEAKALVIVNELITNEYIDPATRFVTVSMNFWNEDTRLLTLVQFVFTFTETGRIDKIARIDGIPLVSLETNDEKLVFGIWVLVFMNCGFYFMQYLFEVYRKPSYAIRSMFASMWQIVEFVWRTLIGVFLYYSILYMYECTTIRDDLPFLFARERFKDLEDFRQLYLSMNDVVATTAFWSFTKILKYLRLNNRMNQLWKVIGMAGKELLAFLFLFFIIFTAYAVAGHILFGTQLVTFFNLLNSYHTCFQMLIGSYEDYQVMMAVRPRIAPLFIYSFMTLVFLVIVNMFLAILNDYHSYAMDRRRKNEHPEDGEEDQVVQYDPLLRAGDVYTSLLLLTVHTSKDLRQHSKRGLVIDAGEVFYLVPFLNERTSTKYDIGSNKFLIVYSPTGHHVRVMKELLVPGDKLYVNRRHCLEVLEPLTSDQGVMKVRFVSFYTDYATFHGGEELRAPSSSFFKYVKIRAKENFHNRGRVFGRRSNLIRRQICSDEDLKEVFQYERSQEPLTVDGFTNPDAFLGFDELVRKVRQICAKEQFKTGIVYTEREIIDEVLSYFDRFRVALQTLYSGNYLPKPFDTSGIRLPEDLKKLIPFLAEQVHNSWALSRMKSGYTYGTDNQEMTSPYLLPFNELPKEVQESNTLTVDRAMRAVFYLGYRIEGDVENVDLTIPEPKYDENKVWQPTPVAVDNVVIPANSDLSHLLELMADDTHAVWAMNKMKQGYSYGPSRNTELKTHPGIVPYWDLEPEEQEYDILINRILIQSILSLSLTIRGPTRHRETSMRTLINYLLS